MLNQLRWVLFTYFTRPLFLTLLAAGVLLAVMVWSGFGGPRHSHPSYPPIPPPRLLVDTQATLDEIRAADRQRQVDALDLSRLLGEVTIRQTEAQRRQGAVEITAPPDDFFEVVREFPNLQQLVYQSWTANDDIARTGIGQLQQLEYLRIGSLSVDFEQLTSLKNLRRLDLEVLHPAHNISALASLPRLDTVVFHSEGAVDDAVLAELAHLPHLQTLVLDFPSRHPIRLGETITKAGFAALAQSPSLDKLYLGGYFPDDHARMVALAGPAFLGRTMYASRVESPRVPMMMLMLPLIAVSFGVAAQLVSQFRSPASRLTPRFALPHALVALGWLLLFAIFSAYSLHTAAYSWAVCIVVTAMTASAVVASSTSGAAGSLSGASYPSLLTIASMAFALFLGACLFTEVFRSPANVREPSPPVLALMAVVSVAGISTIVVSCRALALAPLAASYFPLGRDFGRPPTIATSSKEKFRLQNRWSSRRIEALPAAGTQLSAWQRIQRWRAGNMPFSVVGAYLSTLFLGYAAGYVTLRVLGAHNNDFAFGLFMICFAVILTAGNLVNVWRQRLRNLPLELMRPVSRWELQRDLALAFARDVLMLVGTFAVLLAVRMQFDVVNYSVNWPAIPPAFLLVLLVALPLVLAIVATSVLLERIWVALAVGLAVWIFFPAIASFGVTALKDRLAPIGQQYVLLAALAVALLSSAICYLLWRRWLVLEADRRY